jgi:hypothetical protein
LRLKAFISARGPKEEKQISTSISRSTERSCVSECTV